MTIGTPKSGLFMNKKKFPALLGYKPLPKILSEEYDIVILDEVNYAINLGLIDVKEIVKFINFALRKKNIKSEIYNFSSSHPIKFIYLINLIKKIFKSKSKIINKNSNKKSFIISNKKILNNFKYKPSTTKKIIVRCCKALSKKR